MTKEDIIKLIENKASYYFNVSMYYDKREKETTNKKNKKVYNKLSNENYYIYLVLDHLKKEIKNND